MRKIALAVIIIVFLFITCDVWAAPGDSVYDPIIITTAEDLDNVRNGLTKHYKLSNDIDMTSYLESGGAGYAKWGPTGWMSIGDTSTSFIGGFNGNGHKVKGLWMNRSEGNQGLFGHVTNATIENLGVELSSAGIKCGSRAGGLTGYQSGGGIVNCYTIGNVSGGAIDTGGLAGYLDNAIVMNCYATGNVEGDNDVGGLVGYQDNSNITNCYATGNVSCDSVFVGGLVGYQSGGNVANCYVTGDINGNNSGGVVGYQAAGSISNSYRYINLMVNGVIISTSNADSSPDKKNGGVVTVAELMTKATYTDNSWLFNDSVPIAGQWIWDSKGYPKLNISDDNFPFINLVATITIITHPADTSVTAGSIASSLSVSASVSDYTAPSYQWYSNTSASNTGGAVIPGAVSNNFPIPTSLTAGTYYYYCVVSSSSAASESSKAATVTVIGVSTPVITINTHPADASVTAGSITGSLSASAGVTGGGTLAYQWYSNTTASNTGGAEIPGAVSDDFPIPTSLTAGTYYYYCVVSAAGAISVASNAATVTVIGVSAPVITIVTHPADTSVTAGSITGSLSVSANVSDGGALSYQWYSNTTASNTGGAEVPGAVSNNFPIPTSLTAGTYHYYCVVSASGAVSVASNAATVTVNGVSAPVITIVTHPADTSVTAGSITGSLSVSANVTGDGTLAFQWYSNTTASNTGGAVIPGAVSAVFPIPTSLTAGTYHYYCVVSSTGAVSVASNAATVTVNEVSAPVITIVAHPANMSVTAGSITGSLSVSANVTGGGTLAYQWYSNTTASNTGGAAISGAASAAFPIPTNLTAGAYYYYCVVIATGAVSVASNAATVTVTGEPVVIPVTGVTLTPDYMILRIGESRAITAHVIPEDATNQNVTWSSYDPGIAAVSGGGRVTAIKTGTTVITVITEDGEFQSYCEVEVKEHESDLTPQTPEYPTNKGDVSDKTGIPESDIVASGNKLYLKETLANKIAKELLRADAAYTKILPIFSGTLTYDGDTVVVSFMLSGSELFKRYPFEVNLIGMTSKNTGKLFEYVSKQSDYAGSVFTILKNGSIFQGEINPDEYYELLVFIDDGGEYDLDGHVNGEVIASIFLASEKAVSRDGGGCSAAGYGYIVFALFGIVPFARRNQR